MALCSCSAAEGDANENGAHKSAEGMLRSTEQQKRLGGGSDALVAQL